MRRASEKTLEIQKILLGIAKSAGAVDHRYFLRFQKYDGFLYAYKIQMLYKDFTQKLRKMLKIPRKYDTIIQISIGFGVRFAVCPF